MRLNVFIVALVCLTATSSSPPGDYGGHARRKRSLSVPSTAEDGPVLPRHVTPLGYHVWLQPFPQDGHFQGRVEINISCITPTNVVILHAGENLNISSAEIFVIDPRDTFADYRQIKDVSVLSVGRGSPEDWCEVKLSNYLEQGLIYQLTMEFVSDLRNASCKEAMYTGSYSDDSPDNKWFVATDMKLNKARKVFPCFDELSYKASFVMSIGRPHKMRSLSNMALRESEKILDKPGWMWDHFMTSPPMSPFSVNLFIFDPDVIIPLEPRRDLGSTTLWIYAPADLRDDLRNIENKILQTVKKLETYFQMTFPLPDLQIVVSPGVRSNHEGFGLSIFNIDGRDSMWPVTLLNNMADHWLIHLITPHSWSEVSFGNSLASYISYIAYIEVLKDTKYAQTYSWGSAYAMITSSTPHISSIGVCMLRMLDYTLGENTLRSAIDSFLKDRLYETFVSDDMVAAMDDQVQRNSALPTGVTVQKIVSSWMKSQQFPIITVIRNYQTGTAYVEQNVFTRNNSDGSSEREKDLQWYVPLVLLRGDQQEERSLDVGSWMTHEKTVILRNMPPSDIFILVNPEAIGLFIVNYDPTNWRLIIQHLQTKDSSLRLSATTRAMLLTNAALLAKAGKLTYDVPFDISCMLSDDDDYGSLYAFSELFWDIYNKLQYTTMKNLLKEYALKLLSPLYEQYGGFHEKELFDDTTSQGIVMTIMCTSGAEDCTETLAAKYKPGNLTYKSCIVLEWGERYIWDETLTWALGHNKNNSIDADILKYLACCTQHKERIDKLLNAVLLKYPVSDEDTVKVIDRIDNPYALFDFLSNRWSEIKKKYDRKPDLLEKLVEKMTSKFVTPDGYDLVADFYTARQRDTPFLLPVLRNALQTITKNRVWYDRSLPQIESWIRRYLEEN